MKTLAGKTVLVTGAASGIGLECARAFARAGAVLALVDREAAALEPLCAELAAAGVRCAAFGCDVADEAAVQRLAQAVNAQFGPPDVLMNNAGIAYLGGFEETPLAEWARIHAVNVMGAVHGIRAFLPAMRAAGGERMIVNVASAAGFAPMPNMAAYAASKHAVVGLSEVLAMELADTPVRVLVVCPGIINTAIVHVSPTSSALDGAQKARLQAYYAREGCHPSVVAADVVRAVLRGDAFLFTGPLARAGHLAMRLSRRLARRLSLATARRSGYLPRG